MRHFIIALCLWIISQKFRDVTSIRGTLKANVYKLENRRGESSKGEPSKGKPSKGEPSKGEKHKKETSDEEAVPSKKAKPCTRCDECDPNPCVCYLQERSYPVNIYFNDIYINSCQNEKLKKEKSFTVKRIDSKSKYGKIYQFDWDFEAHLDGIRLAWLGAQNGGKCNNVKTEKDSLRCGLSTTLMELCFSDIVVGGLDIENDKKFNEVSRKKWKDRAIEYCKHIVYLECAPEKGVSKHVCSGYMTAAINTKHTMMFSVENHPLTKESESMYVMKVAETQIEFKKNPEKLLEEYGTEWYFCQCKKEKLSECEAMA